MRFFILGIFLSIHFISGAESGIEILKNGTFKNDSFWNPTVNGDASVKYSIENNILSVAITSPGSEWWYIQLTQKNLSIKKDKIYTLSFDIKSLQSRKILTSVCKDGGDYLPYSIRDTLQVDTIFTRYSQDFQMTQPTDSSARVEFDFGFVKGDIQIKNISLLEYSEPKITFTDISPQTVAFSDEPIKLSWSSAGLKDTLNLSVSYDYGFSWSVIKSNLKAIDSLEWTPGSTHSPWCFFKLSTSKISAISASPLQIIPKIELISNGSFRNSFNNWILTADTSVKSNIVVQNGTLSISNTNQKDQKDTVILSQSPIKLNNGDVYEIFFTCYTKTSYDLKVFLSGCKPLAPDGSGSPTEIITVNNTPTRYNKQFRSTKTMSNGELKFVLDSGVDVISFSNISLVNVPVPDDAPKESVKYIAYRSHRNNQEQFRSVFLAGNSQLLTPIVKKFEYFNLAGRKISGKQLDPAYHIFRGAGVVMIVSRNNDHKMQIDTK
jgi:hypothetical protein